MVTFATYLNGTTDLDPAPTNPAIAAGGTLKLVSMAGALDSDAQLSGGDTILVSPGTLSIANSQTGTAIVTNTLSATSTGSITLDNAITTDGTATISTTGGDITFDSGFSISDTGAGHNLTIAAGTSLPHSHYILNNSSAGANAIQVSNGAQFYLYSADPTNDQFNGITVPNGNVVYNASFPSGTLPTGNGELFYVPAAGDVGPNPVGSGNTGGGGGSGGGGGGGGGGTTPPTDPVDVASSIDGSGSNVVPPAITPQNGDVQPSGLPPTGEGSTPPPFSFTGGLATGSNGGAGGLADSSGNGSVVTAGDETVASKDGGVGTNSNPAASDALGLALGPAVHNALNLALTSIGDYTDTTTSSDSSAATSGGGNGETTLGSGQYGEIDKGSGVKTISASQAPAPLQKALGNGVLNGLPGH
jgi:hypothetical protein